MDAIKKDRDLKVHIKRLPQSVLNKYYEKYENNVNYLNSLIIEDDNVDEEQEANLKLQTNFIPESNLNVLLVAKNDKKLIKLNSAQAANVLQPITSILQDNDNKITDQNENKTKKAKRVCLVCSKTFKSQALLKVHMQQQHNDNNKTPKIVCNECGMQYQSQVDFNRHLLTHNQQNMPREYKCTFCSMEFYDLSSKTRHEKEHAGIKSFRCYICGFEFTRASNLRAHLIKVHSSEIGKLVSITKSNDNKLKFEFDIDAINLYKEQQRAKKLNRLNENQTQQSSTPANAIIYIKDPNNKSADIQHMVVYIDGKPIFVQNPKIPPGQLNGNTTTKQQCENIITQNANNKQMEVKQPKSQASAATSVNTIRKKPNNQQQPIAKIPYLLAAAAAAATTNRSNTLTRKDSSKYDQEYQQLVSMFKLKNEKLHNPLAANSSVQNTQ